MSRRRCRRRCSRRQCQSDPDFIIEQHPRSRHRCRCCFDGASGVAEAIAVDGGVVAIVVIAGVRLFLTFPFERFLNGSLGRVCEERGVPGDGGDV